MADSRFHDNAGPFTLAHLARHIGAEINQDVASRVIADVGNLATAQRTEISYVDHRKHLAALQTTQAGAVCITADLADAVPNGIIALITPNPHLSFVRVMELFYPSKTSGQIHATALIDPTAQLGKYCTINAYSIIGAGVILGDHCQIAAHVTISHTIMGNNVRVLPGARLGQEGFGFVLDPASGRHIQVPQLGRVIIEDNVVIGANVAIDRGALSDTIIHQGAIIDNLVQIGHNCEIGEGAILIAQSGLAGSARMGKYAILAAQAGVADHITIGDYAQVGAKSGIMRDVAPKDKILGSPGLPVREFFRQQTVLAKLAKSGK